MWTLQLRNRPWEDYEKAFPLRQCSPADSHSHTAGFLKKLFRNKTKSYRTYTQIASNHNAWGMLYVTQYPELILSIQPVCAGQTEA